MNSSLKRCKHRDVRLHTACLEALEPRQMLSASLVKDINLVGNQISGPGGFVDVNGTLFFAAADASHGTELWKTDGTAAGTKRLTDFKVNEVANSSSVSYLIKFNDLLYFTANDGVHGRELWKSDGTEAGTVLVKEIQKGAGGSNISGVTIIGDTLYFAANDGLHGTELWKTDGTTDGTVLAADIDAGFDSSTPEFLVNVNGTLYFSADDGSTGKELWKFDGAAASRVKDIIIGSEGSSPTSLTAVGDKLYFIATDPAHGLEVWRSDGTLNGTQPVPEVRPGPNSSQPGNLTAVGNTLYFTANDGVTGNELYKTDGSNTDRVKDGYTGPTGSAPSDLYEYNGKLYFVARVNGTQDRELWSSDGTENGTDVLKDINAYTQGAPPNNLRAYDNILYFAASNGPDGMELWRTDGTAENTFMVKDLFPGLNVGSSPRSLTVSNGKLFFVGGENSSNIGIFVTDGSSDNTKLVTQIYYSNNSSRPDSMVDNNGVLYFIATDGVNPRALFTSDGTPGGTKFVKDIGVGTLYSNGPVPMTAGVGGKVFFAGKDATHGSEIWASDGTAGGTDMIADINPTGDGGAMSITRSGAYTYFVADDGTHGPEVYRTDGTAQQTIRLTDIQSVSNSAPPQNLVDFNGTLYFTAAGPNSVITFYKTDGSVNGTVPITTLTAPFQFKAVENKLYFVQNAEPHQLWVTDGSAGNTKKVKDIPVQIGDDGIHNLVSIGGTLYFIARDGSRNNVVWKSDGTTAGTVPVYSSAVGSLGIGARSLVVLKNQLYFLAQADATHGGLIRSNGTEAGTALVTTLMDIAGINVISPPLVVGGDALFFNQGRWLYRSDGTTLGTGRVGEYYTQSGSIFTSGYRVMVGAGGNLFFPSDDLYTGSELWKTGAALNATISGTVFIDSNLNNIKDAGEAASPGITMFLDENGDGVLNNDEFTAITDASGNYAFLQPAGNYRVREVVPATNVRRFGPSAGFISVNAVANQNSSGNNFGNTPNILLAGTVYEDNAPNDGTLQPYEIGQANWRVYIDLNNNNAFDAGEPNRTTNAAGTYQFQGIAAGTGTLRLEPQAGWIFVNPIAGSYSGTMTAGQINKNLNFGLKKSAPAPVPAASDEILASSFNGLGFFES